MAVLSNIFIVETGYSKVKKDVQNHGKVQEREIQSITFVTHQVLYGKVDSEYPERFD
jgi:hypothetical protein